MRRLRPSNLWQLGISVVQRDYAELKGCYGLRAIYDFTKPGATADTPPILRTLKDQDMDQTNGNGKDEVGYDEGGPAVPGSANWSAGGPVGISRGRAYETPPNKPWVLQRAKNWVSGLRNSDKKGVNPKDQLGAAKVPMHLVAPAANIIEALCMDDGNIKYGPYNVRMEPIEAVGYIAACCRHLLAYLDGQDYDSITGKPHLGYARATLGLVIDAWLGGTLIDNRPVAGVGGQLLDALAMKPGQTDRSPDEYRTIFESIAAMGKKQTEERLKGKTEVP